MACPKPEAPIAHKLRMNRATYKHLAQNRVANSISATAGAVNASIEEHAPASTLAP